MSAEEAAACGVGGIQGGHPCGTLSRIVEVITRCVGAATSDRRRHSPTSTAWSESRVGR